MSVNITVEPNRTELGKAAGAIAASRIQAAIDANGSANVILATGSSQFEMLDRLVTADIDWSKVTCFHLDEYVGITPDHPASFVKYLQLRFADRVNHLKKFHFIESASTSLDDAHKECHRLGQLMKNVSIDVACIGIGENAHLAFNDPPADFDTNHSYLVVKLDLECRQQQVGEGWFASLTDVPTYAISMSVRQILKSRSLIVTVPDQRKSVAVQRTVEGEVHPDVPASILQTHPSCQLMLDEASASRLKAIG